ncbi:MAG: hypothetical protein KA004_09735 [Verrucomicrobiales bacterium]|nr:hypothetical protein [Verrucomicrobiales bacterium]
MSAKSIANLFVACLTLGLASCASSKKDAEISKVSYYKLDSRKEITSADPAIPFEQKYRLHGAVSGDEMKAREGHYYTVHYRLRDLGQPVKVRLEYRQSKTAAKIFSKEMDAGKSGTAEFAVIGDEYANNGHVIAWKVSLVSGKQELAASKSYLWE